jgi:hypothetical protein
MCIVILLLEATFQAIYLTSLKNMKEGHSDQNLIEIDWNFLSMYDLWRLGLGGCILINSKSL